MSKQELLIEYSIQDIIAYHIEDTGCDIETAMSRFYMSEVFDKLQDIETGLYLEGSVYVYDLFKIELEYGRLVQLEV
ncbi:MAG: hypothetical protein LBU99_06510 [Spirochaetaceae bacterium]|jgi:hypothetical protein|nr:hypothetical protein [Spirochaetaceae bacterium]